MNRGNVTTLVMAKRLLLEFEIEAVIDDINTRLRRDKDAKILICKKYLKLSERIRNIRGDVSKKNKAKFKQIIIFLTNTIISRANTDVKYC